MKKTSVFAILTAILSVVAVTLTACGGTSSSVQPPPVTVLSVSTTATPSTIQMGQTATCLGTVSYSNSTSDHAVSYTATNGTINASSGVYTPSAAGSGSCTATSTQDSTKSGSATITVNPAPVTVTSMTLTCAPPSITTAQTSACTPTIHYSDGTTSTSTSKATYALASGSVGTVTAAGVYSSTTTGTGNVVATSTENTSVSSTAFAITVTSTAITLTSIKPAVAWCVGQCGLPTFIFNGTNFATGQLPTCTPDSDIQLAQLISSTQANVTLGIDQVHEGSGWRSCKVCKGDGTGCSSAIPLGLYSQNMCAVYPTTGEMFCLNPQETVAGQHLYNGQPLNGYVDKFTAAGVPDGKFFVGAPTCCIAVDNITGLVTLGLYPYDENGNDPGFTIPTLQGGYPEPNVAVAANGGYACTLQPTAPQNLTCIQWTGSPSSTNSAMSITVGSSPQSITMGSRGGKVYVYVVTGGSSPAIWSVDVSDGMTNVVSQPIVGVTADLPGGSAVTAFDASGMLLVTSFGDAIAIPLSETTLKTTGSDISLPGVPVSVTPRTSDGIAIIGNADQAHAGGTFTEVNLVTGTTTLVPSVEASVLPVDVPPPAGKTLFVCPQDGVSPCSSFTLP